MKIFVESKKTHEIVSVIENVRTINNNYDNISVLTYNRESYVLLKDLFTFAIVV